MFIDLSVLLNEQTPVYPGDAKFQLQQAGTFETHGFADSVVSFNNHNGTHVDAPSHMFPDGKSLDQFPIEHFTGPGVLIDARDGFDIGKVHSAKIKEGEIVLFLTGAEFGSKAYFTEYQTMSEEIARYLVQQKIKMVGVDTCSVDNMEGGFPVHKILLKNEIFSIENLTNLSLLQNKSFTVYAFPLKFQLDGSPARVVAEITDTQ